MAEGLARPIEKICLAGGYLAKPNFSLGHEIALVDG
jgi:hypothetical protein